MAALPASIELDDLRVDFAPATGSYAVTDRRDPALRLEGAAFHGVDATGRRFAVAPSTVCAWCQTEVDGPLGRGRRLGITARLADGPELILEIDLYAGRRAVVLNAGIRNTTPQPIQLTRIQPITATVFAGQAVAERYTVLDGTTGCLPTRVWTDPVVECRNNLIAKFGSAPLRCLVVGGLTYHDFEKFARVERQGDHLVCAAWSEDPVGRRVEPGETYLPDDRFYLDLSSADPFAAAEAYARCVRVAQAIELPVYDFPTVCLWWASQVGPLANDSIGAVREMDHIAASGFLKYSPVGVRLLPDSYAADNCDGWWDEEHWQRCAPTFAEPGGCYKAPYETTAKWCQAIRARGGIPIGYMRTNGRSDDYARAFPGHMLFNDPDRQHRRTVGLRWWEKDWPAERRDLVGYDFTDPDFLKHMRDVYANLRQAGLAGIFYDYPKITGWCLEGGFEDRHATTARAYRNIFQVARDGLGKDALLQERAYFLGSDVSLGLVASQRTIWDNTMWAPPVISRAGLRWYKNRVVMNYDTDGKQIIDEYARNGRDGGRAMLTMAYVASARILIANSFAQMDADQLHDLSRVIPLHATPQSARPLDVFSGATHPRVYDFAVDADWHQLTFFNTAIEKGDWPSIDVALEPFTEGRKDFPPHVRALKPIVARIAVELGAPCAEGGLGLDHRRRYYVFDFWNDLLIGMYGGDDRLDQVLRPAEARMMSIHAVQDHPQFLSTNRHVMQGYVDLVGRPAWDAEQRLLSGRSRVVADDPYVVILAGNGFAVVGCSCDGGTIHVTARPDGLWAITIESATSAEITWAVRFARSGQ